MRLMQMKRPFNLSVCVALLSIFAWSGVGVSAIAQTSPSPASKAQAKPQASCRVLYSPARSIWVRELEVDYDKNAFTALRIDGVPVHGFSAEGAQISTHLDNERIYLDLSAPSWRSEFREAAQGEGTCVKAKG
jgi:hypothetical protein